MSLGENIFLSHTESTESTEFPLRGAFCHTDCTDFFFNQNEKNEKEYSLMSLGWHRFSYLNQILKYWKRIFYSAHEWRSFFTSHRFHR